MVWRMAVRIEYASSAKCLTLFQTPRKSEGQIGVKKVERIFLILERIQLIYDF